MPLERTLEAGTKLPSRSIISNSGSAPKVNDLGALGGDSGSGTEGMLRSIGLNDDCDILRLRASIRAICSRESKISYPVVLFRPAFLVICVTVPLPR